MAVNAHLRKNSTGTIRARITNSVTGVKITTGTVTCTLKREGAAVFTAKAMTYDAAGKLDSLDTDTGVWTAPVTAAEALNAGEYSGTVDASSAGSSLKENFTVAVD